MPAVEPGILRAGIAQITIFIGRISDEESVVFRLLGRIGGENQADLVRQIPVVLLTGKADGTTGPNQGSRCSEGITENSSVCIIS